MQVSGSAFLITGGSSGLGGACAQTLRRGGATIVIADLQEPGQEVQDDPAFRFVRTDVTCAQQVAAAVREAVQPDGAGPLRGLINCAGIAVANKILARGAPHDLDLFRKTIDVNLIGTFNAIRLAAAAMATNEPDGDGQRGVIINTASIAAFEGQMGQAAYAASKGAVASMTLPVARDLADCGVRVVTIAPGLFQTPMMDAFPQKVRDGLTRQTVFPKRFGRPDEFAALALHIVENPMLNGQVIRLDGAVRMQAR